MNRRCTVTSNDGLSYGRRRRRTSDPKTDAQQAALGARGPLPHRKNLPAGRATPAAGTASDQRLAHPRPRPDAEHFPRALAPGRLWRGRNSDLLEFRAVHGAAADQVTSDIHCVTTWSRYDNPWEG